MYCVVWKKGHYLRLWSFSHHRILQLSLQQLNLKADLPTKHIGFSCAFCVCLCVSAAALLQSSLLDLLSFHFVSFRLAYGSFECRFNEKWWWHQQTCLQCQYVLNICVEFDITFSALGSFLAHNFTYFLVRHVRFENSIIWYWYCFYAIKLLDLLSSQPN